MKREHAKSIRRYGRAYRAANGSPPPVILHCGDGIFKIDHHRKAHRITRFLEWAKRLERRVARVPDGWEV